MSLLYDVEGLSISGHYPTNSTFQVIHGTNNFYYLRVTINITINPEPLVVIFTDIQSKDIGFLIQLAYLNVG